MKLKLLEFINNNFDIDDKNKLTTKNFWLFFDKIKKDDDILLLLVNDPFHIGNYPYCFATHKLKNIIEKNKNINIFSIGGDICMPPVKDEIQLSYSNHKNENIGDPFIYYEYSEQLQKDVMNIPFKNKLDISICEKILDKNIKIFSTQTYIKHSNIFFIPLGTQLHGLEGLQNFCNININLLEIKKKYFSKDKIILCYLYQ